MKRRIILSAGATLGILGIGFAVAAADNQQLAQAREAHAKARQRAGAAHIPADVSDARGARRTSSARSRNGSTHEVTEELLAFFREVHSLESGDGQFPPEMRRRHLAMMDKLLALDTKGMLAVLKALQNASDLPDNIKQGISSMMISTLSESNPEGALILFNESRIGEDFHARHLVAAALRNLAKENPFAALDWMRKNDGKHPGIVNDEILSSVIGATSTNDPALAFRFSEEFDLKQLGASAIAANCNTPGQRDAAMRVLREMIRNGSDAALADPFFKGIAPGLADETFQEAADWLREAQLTEAEASAFADGILYYQVKKHTGDWIGWAVEHLEPAKADATTARLMHEWTRRDYLAAGTWLAAAPDNATKPATVRAYVEAVAPHEPLTAEQWAVTLSDPAKRRETLQAIHQRWPGDDAEGKAAFAERHAIRE
jgi:hypothetical protein